MEPTIYDITLELQRACAPWALTVKKGDTGRRLRLRLLSGGKAYPITDDCYAVFTAQKPDGTVIYNSCTREGDRFIYDLTPQTTAAAGVLPCELRLYGKGDALLTSAAFTVTVEDTVYTEGDEAVTSAGEATALTRLITQARDAIGEMEKALANEVNHAVIDDSKAGADAWSSKNILDKLCPSFTERGSTVICAPVAGYPLGVVTQIEPAQAGEGEPSPGNVRPITGHTAVKLTHENSTETMEFTADFGRTVYGGSLDWATGALTVDRQIRTFDGTETDINYNARGYSSNGYTVSSIITSQEQTTRIPSDIACSHLPTLAAITVNVGVGCRTGTIGGTVINYDTGIALNNYTQAECVQLVRDWMAAQYAAGTPVQTCYRLATPVTVQLTPTEVLALVGTNCLYSDTGDTTVTGRKDIISILNNL